MKGTLRVGTAALGALGVLLVWEPSLVHAAVACNETQIRAPGCNWGDEGPQDCDLAEEVLCDSNCTGDCVYDFGQSYYVNVYDTNGRFRGANGKSITIKSYLIKTDSSTGKTRFETDGGQVSLKTTDYVASAGNDPDIDISGKIIAPDGRAEVEGRSVAVHQINVEPVDTASGSLPGDLASADVAVSGDKIELKGTIKASGPAFGQVVAEATDTVSLTGGDGIIVRGTNSPSVDAGLIALRTMGSGSPSITVKRKLVANVTTGSGDGGEIHLTKGAGAPQDPNITISASLKVDSEGAGGQGGSIEIEGETIQMTSGTLKANGTGSGGQGGTIDVTAHSTSALVLNKLVSRGGTGGGITVRSDGSITINQDMLVDATNSNPGQGGTVYVGPLTNELALDCFEELKIEQNMEADGYGSAGHGGTIQLEAPTIRMRDQATYLKHIRANGRPNGTAGSGGAITLRAAPFLEYYDQNNQLQKVTHGIVAHRNQNSEYSPDWHHIHALGSTSGSIQTTNNRVGGDYQPIGTVDATYFSCTCSVSCF